MHEGFDFMDRTEKFPKAKLQTVFVPVIRSFRSAQLKLLFQIFRLFRKSGYQQKSLSGIWVWTRDLMVILRTNSPALLPDSETAVECNEILPSECCEVKLSAEIR